MCVVVGSQAWRTEEGFRLPLFRNEGLVRRVHLG